MYIEFLVAHHSIIRTCSCSTQLSNLSSAMYVDSLIINSVIGRLSFQALRTINISCFQEASWLLNSQFKSYLVTSRYCLKISRKTRNALGNDPVEEEGKSEKRVKSRLDYWIDSAVSLHHFRLHKMQHVLNRKHFERGQLMQWWRDQKEHHWIG